MDKTRKQQEFDFKKNLIISAAKKIFFDKGFENATIEDIAREADYSKGSIYSYFKSKNEICFSIVNSYFLKIVELLKKISEKKTTGLDKLIDIKNSFIRNFSQNADYCKIFDSFKYHRKQCAEVVSEININKKYNEEIHQILVNIVIDGITDNSIKANIDAQKFANSLWNIETGIISGFRYIENNSYDYLFELIIESIKK